MIEYLIEHIDALNDDTLNELGKTGWQLVTIYDDIAYFTRLGYAAIPESILALQQEQRVIVD